MARTLKLTAVTALLFPYIVGFRSNPSDSSMTTVELAIGKGSYAYVNRDCSGNARSVTSEHYQDVGISVDHTFPPVRVGIKGGIYQTEQASGDYTINYLNPNVGINLEYIGLDAGAIILNQENALEAFGHWTPEYYLSHNSSSSSSVYPSAALRLGYIDSWYVTTSYFNNLPIVSGGGIVDLGVGFNTGSNPYSQLWLGIGNLPYDRPVFSVKGSIPVSSLLILNLRGSINSHDATEYGFSVGTKFVF